MCYSGKNSILISHLTDSDCILIGKQLKFLNEGFSRWESEKQGAFQTRSSVCGTVRVDIPEFLVNWSTLFLSSLF